MLIIINVLHFLNNFVNFDAKIFSSIEMCRFPVDLSLMEELQKRFVSVAAFRHKFVTFV